MSATAGAHRIGSDLRKIARTQPLSTPNQVRLSEGVNPLATQRHLCKLFCQASSLHRARIRLCRAPADGGAVVLWWIDDTRSGDSEIYMWETLRRLPSIRSSRSHNPSTPGDGDEGPKADQELGSSWTAATGLWYASTSPQGRE